MRPPFHPSVEDITVAGILHALSDPIRAAIYASIATQSCAQNCSQFLQISDQPIPKSTLSQHFKILREAGLIRSARHGVEIQNTPRADEVDRRFPGLLRAILNAYASESGLCTGSSKG